MTSDFEFGALQRSGAHVRVDLRVPNDLVYFEGHFDEWPVLAGVVQLGLLALRIAQRTFPELGTLSRVPRLKFRRPIVPGQTLVLELQRRAEDRIDFTLTSAGDVYATGALVFAAESRAVESAP